MHKAKRMTTYLLVFLFSFLFLKNLLPDIEKHNHDNHDEIGHIHIYHLHDKVKKITAFQKVDDENQSNDENCSSGKSVFTYFFLPLQNFETGYPDFAIAFSLIFKIKSNFLSPDLQPRRKPPRLA